MDQITLDTCLLRDYWEERPGKQVVQQLLDLANAREVDLAVTGYVHDDVGDDPVLRRRLAELPVLGIAEGPIALELDRSVLDGPDLLGSEEFVSFFLQAAKLMRQRLGRSKRGRTVADRDWDHLHAHLLAQRDVFLTRGEGILCLAHELSDVFKIKVMCPAECLRARPTDSSSSYFGG